MGMGRELWTGGSRDESEAQEVHVSDQSSSENSLGLNDVSDAKRGALEAIQDLSRRVELKRKSLHVSCQV